MKRFDWVRCPNCRHKLFKVYEDFCVYGVEIKCSSCKKIVEISRLTQMKIGDIVRDGGRNEFT